MNSTYVFTLKEGSKAKMVYNVKNFFRGTKTKS